MVEVVSEARPQYHGPLSVTRFGELLQEATVQHGRIPVGALLQ